MLNLDLRATQLEIAASLAALCPEVGHVLSDVAAKMEHYPRKEIAGFQAAALYVLAKQYNHEGAQFFEIGTCYGWSAAVMARAAPNARIVTCSPNPNHVIIARQNLRPYPQIKVLQQRSVDILAEYRGPELDLIFVDGDHARIVDDLPWYTWLKTGGLFFHHDWSPEAARLRPCRPVYEALNDFAAKVHPFDVVIVDELQVGMAGWYKREGETWP